MRRVWEWLARNWRLKLAALGVSVLLWSIVKAEEVVSVYIPDVPVRVSLRDPAWTLAAQPVPARVGVAVTGPVREIMRLALQRPRVVVPVEDVHDSVLVAVLRTSWVHMPGEAGRTSVDDIQPATLRLVFSPAVGRADPVRAGRPAAAAVAPAAESVAAAPALGAPVPALSRDSASASSRDSAAAPARHRDTLRSPGVHP